MWLVFKSGFKSRADYDGVRKVLGCFWSSSPLLLTEQHSRFHWVVSILVTVIFFGQDLEISTTVLSQMKLKATDEAADLVGPFHVHLLKGCPNVLVHLFFLFLFLILPQSFRFIRESMTRRAKLCQFVWTSPRQKTQPTNSRLWLKLKLEHVRWLKGLIGNPKNINQIYVPVGRKDYAMSRKQKV